MEASKGINNVCHPRKGEECSELKTNCFVDNSQKQVKVARLKTETHLLTELPPKDIDVNQ